MSECLLWLDTLLHIHVKGCTEEIGEIVQFADGGAALCDTSCGVMHSSLHVTINLLLLLDFAYRELPKVSWFSGWGNSGHT